MLHELKNPRQIDGEGHRRWFTDLDLDLVVWYHDASCAEIFGFQLSYDKRLRQHALTWTAKGGFHHSQVDDGEDNVNYKMTPVLMPAAGFDGGRIQELFLAAAQGLEYGLVNLVRDRITEFDRLYHQVRDRHGLSAPHPSLLGQVMLDGLRDAFYGPALHGPALLPSLKSLKGEQMFWQTLCGDKVMGAWQIALHTAYWKHFTTLRLHEHLGIDELKSLHRFELEDWAVQTPEACEADWQDCLEGLILEHEALVAAVKLLVTRTPQSLTLVEAKSGLSWAQYVYGMAAHDVYHTAQLRNIGIPGLGSD